MTFLEKFKIRLINFSEINQLLLLDVLDFLVDEGNMNIWSSISSKKFFQSLLDLLRTKDIPNVQMKMLGLIQKWGLNFEDRKNALPNFVAVYNKLRNSNVQFPNNYESNYQIYVSNNRSSNNYKNNYDNKNDEFEFENENNDKEGGETFYYMESLKDILKVPNFQHKYRRLVTFLVKMHENIQLANLIMNSGGRSGLKDIINTLREGNNTLIDTINGGRLKDEKLMEITLGTTEDINQTLNRDDDLKNGYKPKKFTSYFVLNNTIPLKGGNNRSRAKSTKPKKSAQRRDDKYKNYDMDLNTYDMNKYKEKLGKTRNANDIFDLFSASNPSNEPGYNNNQPINDFFSSQTQINGNNNGNQYQLRNDPINNIFNINNNNNNNNRSTIMMGNTNNNNTNFFNSSNNNNFNGNNNMSNNNNNNFGGQFNQNNNQSRPVMANYNIVEQSNNFNSQSMQFNQGGFNNNNNNKNNSNNNNNNLMSMLESLGPSPQGNSNQLVPYIGNFNQNNNNNQNNFMNNNNQFNNFNNNNNFSNNNNNQFNNFNNNNQMNNNNNNFDNNRGTTFMSQNMNSNNNNSNQMNFNTNMSINMNNNNFGMGQNNNQQMTLEEMEKQRKLKELDDLF